MAMAIRAFCFGLCITLVGCGDAQQADRDHGERARQWTPSRASIRSP